MKNNYKKIALVATLLFILFLSGTAVYFSIANLSVGSLEIYPTYEQLEKARIGYIISLAVSLSIGGISCAALIITLKKNNKILAVENDNDKFGRIGCGGLIFRYIALPVIIFFTTFFLSIYCYGKFGIWKLMWTIGPVLLLTIPAAIIAAVIIAIINNVAIKKTGLNKAIILTAMIYINAVLGFYCGMAALQ